MQNKNVVNYSIMAFLSVKAIGIGVDIRLLDGIRLDRKAVVKIIVPIVVRQIQRIMGSVIQVKTDIHVDVPVMDDDGIV